MRKVSFDYDFDGFVILYAKTHLVDHYIDKYDMKILNRRYRKMAFNTIAAKRLVDNNYI